MSKTGQSDSSQPQGILTLRRVNLAGRRGGRKASFTEYNQFYQQPSITQFPIATLSFQHGEEDEQREHSSIAHLTSLGLGLLIELPCSRFFGPEGLENAYCFEDPSIYQWANFCIKHLSNLRQAGWEVIFDESFFFHQVSAETWFGKVALITKGSHEWVRLDYGIDTAAGRISIISQLAEYLKQNDGVPEGLEQSQKSVLFFVEPAQLLVEVSAQKLAAVFGSLPELFEYVYGDFEVHPLRAAQIVDGLGAEVFEQSELTTKLAELGNQLKSDFLPPRVDAPVQLKATLRQYQTEGLSWLQFLRENQINGILADDMGLGKTVQTLANLLLEKHSGRLSGPSLIVAPTSVVSNWATEIERFCPDFKLLHLQGVARENDFGSMDRADIILTSYALLNRDIHIHRKVDYYYAVLDEAQMIKNPKSLVTEHCCELKARHRLCLTGTPVENHLGELWSLLHFLLPGFNASHESFRKHWQIPIEKKQDQFRKDLLIKKISPLLLRRTKESVLKELPPRTDIVQTILFEQGQSSLYEKVRSSVDKKLSATLDKQGLDKSHIVVLDGLLKLRQICCDPRLLGTAAANKLKKSAKLEVFESLINKQVEAGRKILVFSQFTSMISLLEESLKQMGIDYTKLTGETTKRDKVIDKFQLSEVPVFLISLKAGGFGLNLTAADCVIHYDPWWNPAVEEQATSRAHRMGQEKPVFVYRLVVKGSIEERILELQKSKADLASAVLSDEENATDDGFQSLTEDDVKNLLAPLD